MLSGRTYDDVCRNFKWEIPEYYNTGVDDELRKIHKQKVKRNK